MRKLFLLSLGLWVLGGVSLTAPALAQVSNGSDVSGTNVNNGPAIFGSSNAGGSLSDVLAAAGATANAADGLLGGPSASYPTTEDRVARTKQLVAQAPPLSPETRDALVKLRDYLRSLSSEPRPNLRAMDNKVRPAVTTLAKDVAAADAACKAQGGSACETYNDLASRTIVFLDALDALDGALKASLPIARTF
ncbi:hypothetical protein BST81_09995 [Leptolyngbya sp. 'hensonii']|uniref:hypothetical protein n=1 Tax=Leptolyngbya sp. 'hensonii' TaxID=1922337 RepID=UPI00094F54EE|nr:hypothetical protein [Leptolyngbya sp. 'hensonii']OLP18608.1 hypothetical protein BST81_09995 [Leptolyngbya sp. 'hensonii']